jgi:DHA2 family multidrug resistance protein-like MFS transporter
MSDSTVGKAASKEAPLEAAQPRNKGLILTTLILGSVVAMINLSMGNVALPSIGLTFNASGTQLNWISDGFTLAMAATVLYLGALGDRYGRKQLFILGAILSVPTALLSTVAWSANILILGRLTSGLTAAMIFPTTLSLISAIWPAGPGRTRAIALWSGIGAGASALGPTIGGFLVQFLSWRWVCGVSIPLVLIALALGWWLLPRHNGENSNLVDHPGGILTVIFVGSLIYAINQIPQSGFSVLISAMFVIALLALVLFIWREQRVMTFLRILFVFLSENFSRGFLQAA